MRDLENCRQEIDEIDAELVRLFERRMGVCRDVALYKQAHYMDILNAAREEAVLKSRAQQAGDPALAQSVMALFTEIMRLSREEQRRYLEEQTETKRIAYSGVPGAYSECAVVGFFGDDCERVNFKTFEEVFAAVADGKARYGVVPVENSSSGSINDVYDLLGKYACHIVGEQLVRVEHCLLGVPGAKVDEITQVFSHEQGFAQCPKFLGEHPSWVTTPYFNTAIAARHVAEMGDKHCAAIASRLAAKHYGLEILAPDIHTFDGNHTRFIVVSASPTPIGIPDKATVTFTLRHERGTLMRALSSFVAMGMNMTHIESRPLHNSNWEYCFYVDLTGNLRDSNLGVLMGSLQGDCENCRLLGVYQAAREDAHVYADSAHRHDGMRQEHDWAAARRADGPAAHRFGRRNRAGGGQVHPRNLCRGRGRGFPPARNGGAWARAGRGRSGDRDGRRHRYAGRKHPHDARKGRRRLALPAAGGYDRRRSAGHAPQSGGR